MAVEFVRELRDLTDVIECFGEIVVRGRRYSIDLELENVFWSLVGVYIEDFF